MLARLGLACYVHRRLVVLAWLAVLVLGVVVGGQVFGRLSSEQGGASWESVEGFDQVDAVSPYGAQVLAVVDGAPVDDPQLRRAVEAVRADLRRLPQVARVVDPYATPSPALVATDRRAVLLQVDLRDDVPEDEVVAVERDVMERLRAVAGEVPSTRVVLGGGRLLQDEVNEQTEADTRFAEFVALPATLVVMVFVFGGWAAALLLLAALVTVGGSLLALLGFSYVIDPMDPSVVSVCTVLGLGLSIDYALLMVNRFREERGLGADATDAIARTAATAGRTILFSGLTVATSLAGLFVFDLSIFKAIGAAGLSVVVVAMVAALTLTPALIGAFGRRIRVPAEPVSDDGFFRRLAEAVQRRAVVVALLVAALLAAAAVPFLGVTFRNGSADLLPAEFESRRFAELQQQRFPSRGVDPVVVVARTSADRLQAYGDRFARHPVVASVGTAEQLGPQLSRIALVPRGANQGEESLELVAALRADRPAVPSWVTGDAAILADFKRAVAVRVPWALAVVAAATFVLLFLMTGSLLVPLKALVMNVLSLGASYGALVWIFQEGNLSGLLGFTSNGGLETWVPVITFAFAFGLSMDYEVFLLSRVKELHDAGRSNDEAVAIGLQRSGRIITLAALLVIIVFAGFAAGKMLSIKELGVALAIAAFVDATLVRCLLVPATMTLLGDRNWWAPRPLKRLHARIGFSEHVTLPGQREVPAPVPVER